MAMLLLDWQDTYRYALRDDAAIETGIKRTALHECLSGRNRTCAGMHWAYIKSNKKG